MPSVSLAAIDHGKKPSGRRDCREDVTRNGTGSASRSGCSPDCCRSSWQSAALRVRVRHLPACLPACLPPACQSAGSGSDAVVVQQRRAGARFAEQRRARRRRRSVSAVSGLGMRCVPVSVVPAGCAPGSARGCRPRRRDRHRSRRPGGTARAAACGRTPRYAPRLVTVAGVEVLPGSEPPPSNSLAGSSAHAPHAGTTRGRCQIARRPARFHLAAGAVALELSASPIRRRVLELWLSEKATAEAQPRTTWAQEASRPVGSGASGEHRP